MGDAYGVLLADRDLLLLQLHAYAASHDPLIRESTRRGFRRLWGLVALLSGRTDEQVKDFFAHGMLLNVIAALDATALDEPWARCCTPVLQRSAPAAQAASGQAR